MWSQSRATDWVFVANMLISRYCLDKENLLTNVTGYRRHRSLKHNHRELINKCMSARKYLFLSQTTTLRAESNIWISYLDYVRDQLYSLVSNWCSYLFKSLLSGKTNKYYFKIEYWSTCFITGVFTTCVKLGMGHKWLKMTGATDLLMEQFLHYIFLLTVLQFCNH